MSAFEIIASRVGSQRLARDLLEDLKAAGFELVEKPILPPAHQSGLILFTSSAIEPWDRVMPFPGQK